MSTQQITPDETSEIPAKSMAGKYDGRKRNSYVRAGKTKYVTREQNGPKPLFERNLARNTAAKLFRRENLMEKVAELLSSPDARLRFEVIRYVWDRLEGKPFVAENPNARKTPQTLNQDNRLQIAIQQLVPAKQPRKSKKTQAIQANSEAKQLVEASIDTQSYVDATAQVVDSTQDGSE